jgi:hypothetical protein
MKMPEAMPSGLHEAGRDSVEAKRGSRPGFREVGGGGFVRFSIGCILFFSFVFIFVIF